MGLVTMKQNIAMSLDKAGIDHDIVPEGFHPSTLLNIDYGNGKEVEFGNFITTTDSKNPPHITFVAPDDNAQYTLIMIDPDAPSKQEPKWGPFRHWVVCNIPSSSDLKAGQVLAPYLGPGPPTHSGDHRYIFLLYQQARKNTEFLGLQAESHCWDFKSFIKQYELDIVGVNYFISKNN